MARAARDPLTRIVGLFHGLAAGLDAGLGDPATARGEIELMRITMTHLTENPIALDRMVEAWIHVATTHRLSGETATVLDWLGCHGHPPGPGDVPTSSASLVRFLPLAALARTSPSNLLTASYHLTALFDPNLSTIWSAVAVNVAASRFLNGSRDFVADTIEALRENQAPDQVLGALRSLSFEPEAALAELDPLVPVDAMHLALWLALREPRTEVVLDRVAQHSGNAWLWPLVGGLLGARDGQVTLERSGLPLKAERALLDGLVAPLFTVSQPS